MKLWSSEVWSFEAHITQINNSKYCNGPLLRKKRVTNCLNSIILMVYVKLLVQFHFKFHVRFRNYDHLKHGSFSLDTKPLKFLSFSNCFYSAIFNRKHLKFALVIHFHEIIPKAMYLAKNFIRHVCGGELKLSKLLLRCFSFHFQRVISWKGKIQMC